MKKIYAIFGATGGIGSVVTKKLLSQENRVYLIGKNEEKLKQLSKDTSQPYLVVNGTEEESIAKTIEKIIEKEGDLHGVASLIGSIFLKPLAATTQKEFEEVIKINSSSAFCILKHSLKWMKSGSIVLCSSTAALIGLSNHEAIAAAKGAIIGLIQSSAASYANKGIRINGVAPGLIRTPLTEMITKNEDALKRSTSFHPLGRIGEPEEVANAIVWLLSEESSFITGEILAVDGGLSSIKLNPSR